MLWRFKTVHSRLWEKWKKSQKTKLSALCLMCPPWVFVSIMIPWSVSTHVKNQTLPWKCWPCLGRQRKAPQPVLGFWEQTWALPLSHAMSNAYRIRVILWLFTVQSRVAPTSISNSGVAIQPVQFSGNRQGIWGQNYSENNRKIRKIKRKKEMM